jgi:hypothetical protein
VSEIDLILKEKTEPKYHEFLSSIETSLGLGEIISVNFQK